MRQQKIIKQRYFHYSGKDLGREMKIFSLFEVVLVFVSLFLKPLFIC